ncbi:helix-turn-helix domain-containing protein [Pontibacillus yanchengensis]|uniref:Transcriptional regulator n=1 Tax=Pontibacillus yanchengensis Y32 TaxID=1385514 RepID=A0A0A2TGA0_9BACI|nr:helix-turn-helix domain-containing protein [Pontibacillus yanchengensis]KGP74589.1 transcriptional regulator [Pontibacillus yanchengensis Y32]
MDYQHISGVIKELRKHNNMTQKELAEDICTQAQISKLENGNEYPSCITLYYISQKLGVDMDYFFESIYTPRLDYVNEVKTLLREFIRERNYEEVFQIVQNEKNTPLFKSGHNLQFLIWHEGIAEYYMHGNVERAIDLCTYALNITSNHYKPYSEREIEILNSIGIIYKENNEHQKALYVFEDALSHFLHLPKISDRTIQIRIIYNASKVSYNLKEWHQGISFCEQGINLCKKTESLYLLGELYYQKGRCYFNSHHQEEAFSQYHKALSVFEIQDKTAYIKVVQDAINEVTGEEQVGSQ